MQPSFDPEFEIFRKEQLALQIADEEFSNLTSAWVEASVRTKYSYGFNWLGIPIIQFPTDLLAFQEIVYSVKPSTIIECGVARGGSAVFWASMQLLSGLTPNVIGVDIEIRSHAYEAIRSSAFSDGIQLIEGSSVDEEVASRIKNLVRESDSVMVVLDSNHTYEHVLKELKLYAELVTKGSYLLVLDTVIENLPVDKNRPWGPGASPQTAVVEFMRSRNDFVNEDEIEQQIGITVAPKGYWRKIT